jgi:hypothetical protein
MHTYHKYKVIPMNFANFYDTSHVPLKVKINLYTTQLFNSILITKSTIAHLSTAKLLQNIWSRYRLFHYIHQLFKKNDIQTKFSVK